jgi:AraC-like DNA-binding protein
MPGTAVSKKKAQPVPRLYRPGPRAIGRCTATQARAYRRRFRNLGWTQNQAARHCRLSESYLARFLSATITSQPVRLLLEKVLEEAEARQRLAAAPLATG